MRSLASLLAIILAIFLAFNSWAGEKELRIATEGGYPPFNYMQNGQPAGFDVDIALALCKAMDVECTIQVVEWERIIDGLVANDYDLIVASMAKTAERDAIIDFTSPYYRSRTNFIGDPTRLAGSGRDQMTGKTIAVQGKTVQSDYLDEHYGDVATITPFATLKEAFAALVAREADAVLTDSLVAYEFLQSERGQQFDYIGDPLDTSDPSSEACIAVRQGATELREALDEALRTIRLDGTYERINRSYFPFSIY